jgi:hypothetical protein
VLYSHGFITEFRAMTKLFLPVAGVIIAHLSCGKHTHNSLHCGKTISSKRTYASTRIVSRVIYGSLKEELILVVRLRLQLHHSRLLDLVPQLAEIAFAVIRPIQ